MYIVYSTSYLIKNIYINIYNYENFLLRDWEVYDIMDFEI